MGRLTPCIFKVLKSAKESRIKREMSTPLSGLLAVAVSNPHPRPQSVRARNQSATTTAVCPCPRPVGENIQVQSAAVDVVSPCPHPLRDRDRSLSVSEHNPRSRSVRKYLRQQSCKPGWEQAEGVLLYPRTTRDFVVEFTTHGHRIRALTLDLAQRWQNIHQQLMGIVSNEHSYLV
jgi:hypothetical protein